MECRAIQPGAIAAEKTDGDAVATGRDRCAVQVQRLQATPRNVRTVRCETYVKFFFFNKEIYMQTMLSVLGRIMIATIFLLSAVGNKIPSFSGVAAYIASEGVPLPQISLALAILFLVVGSLSVITGYQIRIGAGLLLVFLVLATYFFHDFWTFEGEARQQQMIQFMKNLALMGTMLFLIANGPGLGAWKAGGRSSGSSEG